MYICICKGITEKDIKEAIKSRRNASAKEILKSLGVGSDCGTCVESAVEQLLNHSNKNQPLHHKDTVKTK
jgi:bacterioferritin-associated ferredoxin